MTDDDHEPITLEWALEQMNHWHGRAKAAEEERDKYREVIGELYVLRANDKLINHVRKAFGVTQAFARRNQEAGTK